MRPTNRLMEDVVANSSGQGEWGVRYMVFNRRDERVIKERWFKSDDARKRWLDKQEETNDAWAGFDSYCDPRNND